MATRSDPGSAEGRRYGGADPAQRQARRRRALIDAGLEVFGTVGFANSSVKRICDTASLTQRYFYESFADRGALLVAVYLDCVATAHAATVTAAAPFVHHGGGEAGGEAGVIADSDIREAARATLGAFLGSLADDPRRARVMLIEIVGATVESERTRQDAIHGWADLIWTLARGETTPEDAQRVACVGLVGAVTQLLVDWFVGRESGTDTFDLDLILDVCVEMFEATHQRLLR